MTDDSIIYKDQSYKIIGACMAVHRELGCVFLEAVYQEALEEEFKCRNIPYVREEAMAIVYKGTVLHKNILPTLFVIT